MFLQDEKALYGAADRGDVSAVRRLLASHVNVNCTSYPKVQCDSLTNSQSQMKSMGCPICFSATYIEWLDSTDDSIIQWTCGDCETTGSG